MGIPHIIKEAGIAIKFAFAFLSLGLICFTATVSGEPLNEIGYAIGYSSNNYSIKFADGNTRDFKSSGVSLGIDAQFLATRRVTLNPFLIVSQENSDFSGRNFFNGIGGLQTKYWKGQYFLGASIAYYLRVITGEKISSNVGPGVGITGGWEHQSGYFISLRADKPFYDGEQIGFQIQLGIRWK